MKTLPFDAVQADFERAGDLARNGEVLAMADCDPATLMLVSSKLGMNCCGGSPLPR